MEKRLLGTALGIVVLLGVAALFTYQAFLKSLPERIGAGDQPGMFQNDTLENLLDADPVSPEIQEVQLAFARLIEELQPLDPEHPGGPVRILFQSDVSVHETEMITSPDPDAINKHTTELRAALPYLGGYANGCGGVSASRVQSLEHYPDNFTSIAEFQDEDLRAEMTALYRDGSVRSEISADIGNPKELADALDALAALLEDGTYHPFAIGDICYTQTQIQVSAATGVPAFGDFPDPQVLIWNGESFDVHTQPFGLGGSSYYAFLPATQTRGSALFISDQLPGTGIEFWGFYELNQETMSFDPIEICSGYIEPKEQDDTYLGQVFTYGCSPEYRSET